MLLTWPDRVVDAGDIYWRHLLAGDETRLKFVIGLTQKAHARHAGRPGTRSPGRAPPTMRIQSDVITGHRLTPHHWAIRTPSARTTVPRTTQRDVRPDRGSVPWCTRFKDVTETPQSRDRCTPNRETWGTQSVQCDLSICVCRVTATNRKIIHTQVGLPLSVMQPAINRSLFDAVGLHAEGAIR